MLEGLIQALGITKERYASPLDVHHCITHYNSAYPRDAVFGADGGAHEGVWTGWSWCHPPHDTSAADAAVAWAVASARAMQEQGVPSATLMLLPNMGTAPAHKRRLELSAEVATHLATIAGRDGQSPCMWHLPAGWWAGGPAHELERSKSSVDLVLVWNEAARSEFGLHAAAVAEAIRQSGPEALRAAAPLPPNGPPTRLSCAEHERWLGELLLDTIHTAVGDMSGLRRTCDREGAPSQGDVELRPLPPPWCDEDERQLGRRAVGSWLSGTDLQQHRDTPLSQVYGGREWGLSGAWHPGWKPQPGWQPNSAENYPRHFGKARATPEPKHWGDELPRVHTTGWTGARDALRPAVTAVMRAWGTPEHVAGHPLRWDWRDMAYTDGSLIKSKDSEGGAPMGAAVFVPEKEGRAAVTHLVAPGGEGPSWTVTRAELAAIWVALLKGYTTIATDSLASIWLIQAAVGDPMRLRRHKHRPLLAAIVELIDAAPSPVTIVKVAAHQGLGAMGAIGNNEADLAAKKAACSPDSCDECCDVEAHGFDGQIWIVARTKQDDDSWKEEHVNDLRADLTRRMRAAHRLGNADPGRSLYASLWRDIAPRTLRAVSNAFASDTRVGHAQKRTVWAYRTGTLFNKKLEQRWFRTGDGRCPLCGQPDGGGHIAGGCLDPRMRGMYTTRHDAVARVLLKAVARGKRGAEVCGADVGSEEHMREEGLADLCAHRRVMTCLLPPGCGGAPSRPDAWMVTDGIRNGLGWARTKGSESDPLGWARHTTVTLVEVKMCPDTDPTQQRERAQDQHAELESLLQRRMGWRGTVVRKTVLVGHSGTIYSESLTTLTDLGVTRQAAKEALKEAHGLACQYLHSIVGVRRHAEPPRVAGGGAHRRTRKR